MAAESKKPGAIVDEMLSNPRRLGVAHLCLGLVAAFAYWVRPGTAPIPVRWSVPHYADVIPIISTFIAWLPYLISGLVSQSLLSNRDPKATLSFIAFAIVITAISIILYLNLLGLHQPPSPLLISAGVTLALIAALFFCQTIWPSDTVE